jgi:hypothetical protein
MSNILMASMVKALCATMDKRPAILQAIEYHPSNPDIRRLWSEFRTTEHPHHGLEVKLIENREVPVDEFWFIYPMTGRIDQPHEVRINEPQNIDMGPANEDYTYTPQSVRVVKNRIVEPKEKSLSV